MQHRGIHLIIGILLFTLSTVYETPLFNLTALGLAVWMVYWWITQPIPLYLTALLPIITGLPAGLISQSDLAQSYGNPMIFLFFGGFVIALAIEKSNLHQHIAFSIIRSFGSSPSKLLGGFMVATAFLSMWISNTATTLMMLPIAVSVIRAIPRYREKRLLAIGLLLSIAFAANIGGTATLIGTPPNIQMAGILDQEFNMKIDFFDWLIIGLPFMLVMLTVTYFILRHYFFRNARFEMAEMVTGKLSKDQKRVLMLFSFIVLLWIGRSLINMILPFEISDTDIALVGAIALFVIPSSEERRPLLIWEDMKKLPWGILFLFGGGLALASILDNANIVGFLVNQMKPLITLPVLLLIMLIFSIAIFATELMSNLALVSLLIPLMGKFAIEMDLPLFGISAGIALGASCAFMLPVATPPNAIVYSSNIIKIGNMVKIGLLLNFVTTFLVTLLIYFMFF
ncbi:MAG: DASS family sodium-coupled anion symporter [Brumimicrobium sp.]|nr:DASS family sodium-coupled anion symporter [Brumimicrobium sp.]